MTIHLGLTLGGLDVMVHEESSYAINAAFLTPIRISRQSWIYEDKQMGCMVSRIGKQHNLYLLTYQDRVHNPCMSDLAENMYVHYINFLQ